MSPKRYRSLFRLHVTRADAVEVDEEFRFHLAMRGRELEALGYAPARARAIALTQFGDIDDARRVCRAEDEQRMRQYRRTLWLDSLRQDLGFAVRAARRNPVLPFTTVAVLGLAIAIATTAYGVTHAYLIRPLPFPAADRLVQVIPAPTLEPFPNAPSLQGVDWTVADSVFDATVAWNGDGFILAGGERPEAAYGAWVAPGYLAGLGLRPALGRAFTPEEHATRAPVAIISDALWQRKYNRNQAVIGSSVRAYSAEAQNLDETVTIVGVMPPEAWHTTRFTDVLRPLDRVAYPSMARLKPGMTIAEAERRLNDVVRPQLGAADPKWRMSLVGVQAAYTRSMRPAILALLGGAVFLLLIGAASIAATHVARAASRQSEFQVRAAIGASRGRIMRQVLVESLGVSVVAGVIGATLSGFVLSSLGDTVAAHVGVAIPGGAQRLALGGGMLVLVAGVGVFVGTVFGVIPAAAALRGAKPSLIGSQKGTTHSAAAPALRRGLIVAQVAITFMLVVGAGLMARTMLAIGGEPLGFEPRGVVKGLTLLPGGHFPDAPARRRAVERIVEVLAATPGVRYAAASWPHPFRGTAAPQPIPITPDGRSEPALLAVQHVITAGYFNVLSIPIVDGRDFESRDDGTTVPAVIVSAELVKRLWPSERAVGRRVRVGADTTWRTIVGIVGDTREIVTAREQRPDVYLPFAQLAYPVLAVLARVDGDPAQAVPVVRGAVGQVNDVLALADVGPLSASVEQEISRPRALAVVLGAFAALALGLAMLGLFASLSYVVAQRRREIAIRVAVGADAAAITRLVLGEGGAVVAAGLVSGALLSFVLARVIASQLYGVRPTDPATLAGVAALLGIVGLAASLSPLRKAMRVHPVEILRGE